MKLTQPHHIIILEPVANIIYQLWNIKYSELVATNTNTLRA